MSRLLDALIVQRKQEAVDYEKYLAKVVELTKLVSKPEAQSSYPPSIKHGSTEVAFRQSHKFSGSGGPSCIQSIGKRGSHRFEGGYCPGFGSCDSASQEGRLAW